MNIFIEEQASDLEDGQQDLAASNDLAKLLDALRNPSSIWHQVRLAEMPSKDYIFLPWQICTHLQDLYAIEEFVNNMQTFIKSDPKRTLLVGYEQLETGNMLFQKMTVLWSEHVAISWKKNLISTHSDEYDFMCTLFDHSEPLMR